MTRPILVQAPTYACGKCNNHFHDDECDAYEEAEKCCT